MLLENDLDLGLDDTARYGRSLEGAVRAGRRRHRLQNLAECSGRNVVVRVVEIRVVQHVEEVRADLDLVPFAIREVLADVQVGIEVVGPRNELRGMFPKSCWFAEVAN